MLKMGTIAVIMQQSAPQSDIHCETNKLTVISCHRKWFCSVIIWVRVVLKRNAIGDWCFSKQKSPSESSECCFSVGGIINLVL